MVMVTTYHIVKHERAFSNGQSIEIVIAAVDVLLETGAFNEQLETRTLLEKLSATFW